MGVNGITSVTQGYDGSVKRQRTTEQSSGLSGGERQSEPAAVYEKGEVAPEKVYKQDTATIERMKAEAERRNQNLRELVEKLLKKQGQAVDDATDIFGLLREGKLQVDPEVSEQAKKDIAEDGFWGVEQTSERILSFAKALAGGDPSKADQLIDAVKKGFEEATKAWGDNLPDICKKTVDSAITKLEAWRDGKESK